jgi:hypothetical protein
MVMNMVSCYGRRTQTVKNLETNENRIKVESSGKSRILHDVYLRDLYKSDDIGMFLFKLVV